MIDNQIVDRSLASNIDQNELLFGNFSDDMFGLPRVELDWKLLIVGFISRFD